MVPEALTLSCKVDVDDALIGYEELFWKKCTWTRLSNDANGHDAVCFLSAIDDHNYEEGICDSSMGNVRIGIGTQRLECTITLLKTQETDNGGWKCTLDKCQDKMDGGCKDAGSSCTRSVVVNATVYASCIKILK